ncbi:cyclophilin-like family protein [Natronolimnohabitans sp. A-GB9]|uniref:cyclophilin-like family protein n=1 Tax=Natronolimnohabitans sp. A-GB9 TaxID=3069757 RepID=UPI0027AE056C|nr:cyclophilin-like family protein [Natronolimnohabitans sp. A-GB9]MDQ2049961.1 cyclophilin-like family protein [Natronolimnohabitans sp. A-GB9]
MTALRVTVDDRTLEATWTDDAPETRAKLMDAFPVAGEAVRWGDELYFDVSLDAPPEDAREVVPEGAIAYWPAGGKLCLFWGPTPASVDDEPRAAAPVTVVARIDDVSPLSDLEGGARVRLESVDEDGSARSN